MISMEQHIRTTKAQRWYENSPTRGNTRLVLRLITDHCVEHGSYLSPLSISMRAQISLSTVEKSLKQLVAEGLITHSKFRAEGDRRRFEHKIEPNII